MGPFKTDHTFSQLKKDKTRTGNKLCPSFGCDYLILAVNVHLVSGPLLNAVAISFQICGQKLNWVWRKSVQWLQPFQCWGQTSLCKQWSWVVYLGDTVKSENIWKLILYTEGCFKHPVRQTKHTHTNTHMHTHTQPPEEFFIHLTEIKKWIIIFHKIPVENGIS